MQTAAGLAALGNERLDDPARRHVCVCGKDGGGGHLKGKAEGGGVRKY